MPLDNYPEMGLLDHILNLALVCRGTSILVTTVAILFGFSTNSVQGYSFSTPSPTVLSFAPLLNSHTEEIPQQATI